MATEAKIKPVWDDLSPRDRDALVAEEVMGWANVRPADNSMRDPTTHGWWEDVWGDVPGAEGNPHCVPGYSTDIAAAWEVFEVVRQMAADAGLWGPTLYLTAPLKGGKWMVRLKNDMHGGMNEPHTDDTIWMAHGDTAPEAICLAALRAKGVEV